ncbi:hypothetical protein FDJ23_gp032 [Erwinia phage vB_EamM_Desertfox]|jgi:hypothetical protein|uniref:RHD domain-containing protein n=3 Tax=Agricanvirus TaxID=1984776 RepID=A0A191ZBS7_9CAUD|nr:hypothetical protein FDH99_gp033 [Erwinia phage vB_EamM_Simmy50]YP_009606138.1 hypothetical protein FDI00_gp032 [Erwinia phage vB_EamM_Special G]YP_009621773.1 hypothetical protein FDJ23_gp032 [Erwinia phage vB_EamM_Desertfox]ANH51495.2 hypothetical protein SIMMY50_33 [Erwinia phage vB_EamM_Simmy50]ANJ64842.3 hypothetical protein SPECIALG_32 [Erwinia phage vB_EamM_Special G]AUG86140.1 hypothetical protein DESERTFOX_32 [Erwinia phage vB_EamM_Desertfox]
MVRADTTIATKGKVVRLSVTGYGVMSMDGVMVDDPKQRVNMRTAHPSQSSYPLPGEKKWYEVKRVEQTANGWCYPVVGLFKYPGDATNFIQSLIQKYKLDQEKPHE